MSLFKFVTKQIILIAHGHNTKLKKSYVNLDINPEIEQDCTIEFWMDCFTL